MRRRVNRVIVTVVLTLSVAALLGGSLGIAAAGNRKDPLVTGVNPTVGGPLFGDVTPAKFMSCLPGTSWTGLYIWVGQGQDQRWLHYFNTAIPGVPGYVNDPSVNGIVKINRLQGVAIVMAATVNNPFFPDRDTDFCP
jgi:hypothetical protein